MKNSLFLLLLVSLCSSISSAGGNDLWTKLQKTIRSNKAYTDEGAAARNKIAQSRMAHEIGDDVITCAKTVSRLKEVIDAFDADTHHGALARCNLVYIWVDGSIGQTGVTKDEAVRLLLDVIKSQSAETTLAVAARFLFVRMRQRDLIDDAIFPIPALIALMREVIEHYQDPERREAQVLKAEAAIHDLTLLLEAARENPATRADQEAERKRARTQAEIAAEVDARLGPVIAPPPLLPILNDNNADAANGEEQLITDAAAEFSFTMLRGFSDSFSN